MKVKVEFTGGLETLFGKKELSLSLDEQNTLTDLIALLRQDYCYKDKVDLFALDDSVRPGILVLINDTDWELEGEGAYQLQDKDNILFVSTLHGG